MRLAPCGWCWCLVLSSGGAVPYLHLAALSAAMSPVALQDTPLLTLKEELNDDHWFPRSTLHISSTRLDVPGWSRYLIVALTLSGYIATTAGRSRTGNRCFSAATTYTATYYFGSSSRRAWTLAMVVLKHTVDVERESLNTVLLVIETEVARDVQEKIS